MELSKETFNQLTGELLERMDATLAEWEEEEPQTLWWSEQHDFRQARDTILALVGGQP